MSDEKIRNAVQEIIGELMEQVMHKVLNKDPFIKEKFRSEKPLYATLVPDEIFKGSHFERRFVTPFGRVWEKLAVAAAKHTAKTAIQSHSVDGLVKQERLRRISETLNKLEHSNITPSWDKEINYILDGGGEDIPTTVICDIYIESDENKYAYELKAPLPNSDQTKVSKEKLLKLYSMEPIQINEAYFALPYNPYGGKEDYKWSFPKRWFDMTNDSVVLIGDEFWDMIGGTGTYQAFISAINELGKEYRGRIYREFLGIEPPDGSLDWEL